MNNQMTLQALIHHAVMMQKKICCLMRHWISWIKSLKEKVQMEGTLMTLTRLFCSVKLLALTCMEWLVVIYELITEFMLIWSSFAKINPATGNLLNNDNCKKLQSCTLVDKLST